MSSTAGKMERSTASSATSKKPKFVVAYRLNKQECYEVHEQLTNARISFEYWKKSLKGVNVYLAEVLDDNE